MRALVKNLLGLQRLAVEVADVADEQKMMRAARDAATARWRSYGIHVGVLQVTLLPTSGPAASGVMGDDAPFTDEQREAQRRSFAYGNTHLENESITREDVDRAAEELLRGEGAHGVR